MSSKNSKHQTWSKESLYGHGGLRELTHFTKYIDHLNIFSELVLDIGCGEGLAVKELRRRGVKAIGLDIMLVKWEGIPATVADGTILPFASQTFSAVGCFAVLEHLPNPEKLLEEMARVLKPGGKIVVGCPNMRGVLMLRPGHFVTHQGGLPQRIRNLGVYIKLSIKALFAKEALPFQIVPPPDMTKIPEGASDYNAICATNFPTIKHKLYCLGFKMSYISPGMQYSINFFKQKIINFVDKVPVLREMFGGLFIVGIKR